MPRRSPRLETSGYYDNDRQPLRSYKETTYRIFKRRLIRCHSEPNNTETTSNSRHPAILKWKLYGISVFILPLFCGLTYLITALSSSVLNSGPFQSPALHVMNMDSAIARYEQFEKQMKELQEELLRLKKHLLPDADTLPNFALESLGAKIVLHQTSELYQTKETCLTIFGIPIYRPAVHPSTVIQGHSTLLPGRCWPFEGGQGHLYIKLSHPVTISHVKLSHIHRNSSPTGTIPSAPKDFSVYGMENVDDDGTKLGSFHYEQDGDPVQIFLLLDQKNTVFKYAKLQVESNWGNPDYTCLYSFSVHGKLAD
ncbi:SUN domain-containing protein 1-like [Mastacembelus armatus]|uniref:SUN domain-containing protein 1-like n=1 Tax=Mastacembelus armatus TaxID=205130 RepID=UPI000E4589CF|nr:SUN domain-containing protein 1-like [Mastacembelus armatus]XP_026172864.1 SUN domain-containing protein 1-like [Mastacembelus armatus]XP_026172866.1 SUN domain-containing protein 1-like [Mastacembelus armatus]XP_026172867.1 SUN domain-containing protein 1-like [Mastacembelus armatus]XP_026172868.1 SUN domain-containing protein 1-like [Mastacembelus armatus]